MLRDAVRGAVAVATVVAEETGRRVLTTATGLLERGGVDVSAVERVITEQFPPSGRSLQNLAQEAVTAGRAGVDLAVGVARSEAERIFERVGDQVMKVGVVLSFLESQLRDTEEKPAEQSDARSQAPTPPAPRAEGLFEAGWDDEEWGGTADEVPADAWAVPDPADPVVATPAEQPPAKGAPVSGPKKAPAKKAPARKAPAKKAPVRKADGVPAGDGAAKQTAPEPSGAKKASAKKTTAKKATAKKTVTRKAVATPAETPAARKAAARKTVVRKATSSRAEPRPGTDG
ncbi:hypothetical protein [Kitasatospora sp. NPDC094015]|uniref:hypothetical protein n=1 Tax=Kitasatospora sp. NPDC094015 TaxID=3155205 RepID=UPI00332FA352